jgi:hypothetical protein
MFIIMMFKPGDVLEYANNMYGIITHVRAEGIFIDLSDGSNFILTRAQLMLGVAKGNIKFRSYKKDEVSPAHWFYSKFKFNVD